ncbi:hypothetical protein G7K_1708-t1 [Saitoella complicata NRRL Y-17804]|uniref:Uncharacterized protein n=1 Tax=Saitoella complicata (strain BCRC 22490 / CBS 7301 / JCM 7358 / NBRC 10748 / NRRL Y-17804) TaxID=698492 RepID=A0A0E9NCB1_SAICN|nr:hypothetical protein G7K_1708-t1 [Saitoella complicata NRRL Y-17804]
MTYVQGRGPINKSCGKAALDAVSLPALLGPIKQCSFLFAFVLGILMCITPCLCQSGSGTQTAVITAWVNYCDSDATDLGTATGTDNLVFTILNE